jgi:hypothetical protein
MRDGINKTETLCTNYIQDGVGTCPATTNSSWDDPVTSSGTYAIYKC